jgi:hypothetical protein
MQSGDVSTDAEFSVTFAYDGDLAARLEALAVGQDGGHNTAPDKSLQKHLFSLARREPSAHERQALTQASGTTARFWLTKRNPWVRSLRLPSEPGRRF